MGYDNVNCGCGGPLVYPGDCCTETIPDPPAQCDSTACESIQDAACVVYTGEEILVNTVPFIATNSTLKEILEIITSKIDDIDDDIALKSDIGHGHVIGDVADLSAQLLGKSNTGHVHATSEVTGLDTALGLLIPSSEKGVDSGVATLDTNGVIPHAQKLNDTEPILAETATTTINWNLGSIFDVTLYCDTQLLFTPITGSQDKSFSGTIILYQATTGGWDVTLDPFAYLTNPSFDFTTGTANKKLIVNVLCISGTWYLTPGTYF